MCFSPLAHAQAVPEIPFESVADPLKLPADMYFGEVAGIAVNSRKHIFVLSRGNTTGPAYGAAAAQLLEFDANGRYLREIGHNLYAWSYAHSVRIDRDDNVWVADKGSDVVVRFDPQGRVTRVFGRKSEASDDSAHPLEHPKPPLPPVDGLFRQVTDMTWDSHGNTYISDGYINSRIAKFDMDGNWVTSWGEPGSGPGQLTRRIPSRRTPPTLSMWRIAATGVSRFSTLRGNWYGSLSLTFRPHRTHRSLSGTARFNREIRLLAQRCDPVRRGRSASRPVPEQFLYVADAYPGRIYKLSLDGRALGWLGGSGKVLKKFGWIHALACPAENELYVAELLNWRAQKLLLHPAN